MADRDDTESSASNQEPLDRDAPNADDDIVRRHLTRAWQSWAPAPGLDARVRARLTSSGAASMGAVGLIASSSQRPSPWASLQASGKVGALVGAGLLGLGFLSGYLAHSSLGPSVEPPQPAVPAVVETRAPGSNVTPMVAPPVRIDPPRAAELAAPHEPAPVEPERARKRAPRAAAPNSPAPDVNAELALLQRAERAVRSDNAALALTLIDELEARYPRSTLLEERGAIELLAHCGAGGTDASSRADRFLRQHPTSLYAGRIRALCAIHGASGNAEPLTKPSSTGHGSEQKEPR